MLLVAAGLSIALCAARANASGTDLVTLKSLDATTGSAPYGSVVRTSEGDLWGATSGGGVLANALGTLFLYDPSTPLFTDEYSYNKKKKAFGSHPFAPLTLGSDGNLYGVTEFGGANGFGTVFQLTPSGAYNVIYSFKGTTDGADPYGGLVEGSDGYLYGTTLFSTASSNSPAGDGTIFKITRDGKTIKQLHVFTGTDGSNPEAALTVASDGYLYGVTRLGGVFSSKIQDYGVLFRISITGTSFKVIHTFEGGPDGGGPACTLLQAGNGTLYGTTNSSDLPPYPSGYTPPAPANYGTVFSVTTGATPTFKSLASFIELQSTDTFPNGEFPSGSLVQLSNGEIYGTVQNGGPSENGGIFVFNPATDAAPTMVYNFTGSPEFSGNPPVLNPNYDGAEPVGGLTLGQDGNVYGTTTGGFTELGDGTIFEMYGAPSVSGISPTSVTAGENAFDLTINGGNFNPNSAFVTDNGYPLAINSITNTKIIVTVPSAYVSKSGVDDIVVYNDPNIPGSNVEHLTVTAAVPVISSIDPTSTIAGTAGFTLAINGSGFVTSGEKVTFGGAPVTVVAASSSLLDVSVTSAMVATAGTRSVIVDDDNGAASSSPATFTVLPTNPGQPTITELRPPSITAGAPQFTLAVYGTNFSGSSDQITFGGTALSVLTDDPTKIQAIVPASLVATGGFVNVVERNGTAGLFSNPFTFTVKAPAPTPPILSSLTPATIVAGSATFTLTIAGSNFNANGVTVDFGAKQVSVTSITAGKVLAIVPAADIATAGPVSVTVNNDNSAGPSNALTFTIKQFIKPTPVHTYAAGLQMISMPDDFPGISPSNLLGTTIKLSVWDPSTFAYVTTPNPPADAFRLGQGYWVNLAAAASLYQTANQADPKVPYSITLTAGWNMIGDPFTVTAPITDMTFQIGSTPPITFAEAITKNLISGALWSFGPTSTLYTVYGAKDSLQAYAGYWIFVSQSCTLNVSAASS